MDYDGPRHLMPLTRVELCVFGVQDGRLTVLLIRREEAPFAHAMALPGGIVRTDLDQDLDAAVRRVARERVRVDLPYVRQQVAVGGKSRDLRAEWALSVLYRALVNPEMFSPQPGKRVTDVQWCPVDEVPPNLAFDHRQLIENATAQLRKEVEDLELPFEFLPKTFTLSELQHWCEKVLGRSLDKSSFRRRLADRGLLEPTGLLRTGANRPAQLYRARGGN